MTTTASGHRRNAVALGVVALILAVLAGVSGWLLAGTREQQRDDAVVGEKQAVADEAAVLAAISDECAADQVPRRLRHLCDQAAQAEQQPDPDDPELQDAEVQEPEVQDPEISDPERQEAEEQEREQQERETQDSETQDPETDDAEQQDPEVRDEERQDPESQDAEVQDEERQDPESQDDETQDAEEQEAEVQEDEVQDDEVQDPEVDDPDPNSLLTFVAGAGCDAPAGQAVVSIVPVITQTATNVVISLSCTYAPLDPPGPLTTP